LELTSAAGELLGEAPTEAGERVIVGHEVRHQRGEDGGDLHVFETGQEQAAGAHQLEAAGHEELELGRRQRGRGPAHEDPRWARGLDHHADGLVPTQCAFRAPTPSSSRSRSMLA